VTRRVRWVGGAASAALVAVAGFGIAQAVTGDEQRSYVFPIDQSVTLPDGSSARLSGSLTVDAKAVVPPPVTTDTTPTPPPPPPPPPSPSPPPPPPPPSGFSFQQAYNAAAAGAVVKVPPGQVVADAPARGSATIFGGTKQVTFECQDPNGLVTISPSYPRLTIKASNVTIRGGCFRLRDLWVGEPGDDERTASNVVVDGVKMQGLEIMGSQATIRNSEVGPNVLCYAQSSTVPAAMKCNPNGPPHEADYAGRGSDDLSFQPFFHNNSGGVRAQVLFENNYVHDVQTKDADRLHTGCGLVWQPSNGNAPLGEITIRGNRYERCAVLGILFSGTDGVILENNWMGPPVEPLSNPNGGQVAGTFAKEITARDLPGYDRVRNWRVTGNTLCHGTRSGQPAENVVFTNNDLGRADAPWVGATYTGNTNIGASC
jgi:hypothetical protein